MHGSGETAQRFRPVDRRSRDAANFRRGVAFLAEPFTGALRARVLAVAGREEATRLAPFFAEVAFAAGRLAGFAGRLDSRRAAPAFFSALAGAAAFGVLAAIGLAAAAGAADAAGDVADVLPFGRPPFRANCASANIFRKASCASAISCTCETRRSRSALSFSAL